VQAASAVIWRHQMKTLMAWCIVWVVRVGRPCFIFSPEGCLALLQCAAFVNESSS
jgi:hypothetical protein